VDNCIPSGVNNEGIAEKCVYPGSIVFFPSLVNWLNFIHMKTKTNLTTPAKPKIKSEWLDQ
jgi:hypothetical protein